MVIVVLCCGCIMFVILVSVFGLVSWRCWWCVI